MTALAARRPAMVRTALATAAMVEPALATANRRLIEAIEVPPDAGVERRLDRVAAVTRYYARETDRRPDPGRLRGLAADLSRLEAETDGRKQLLVRDARTAILRAAAGLEPV